MRVVYERCCGLDVHKASIAACALVSEKGKTKEETRRFGSMSADLVELAEWLQQKGIQHVAMESTGVYWKPVWNILEPAGLELLLANAQDVKIFHTGFQYTPVDSIATCWIPFCWSHSASSTKSAYMRLGRAERPTVAGGNLITKLWA